MTTPNADPLVGRMIGQYHIVARVGGGAMGVVYRARDEKLGRVVALKFLPQQWSHDETAKQRFLREAQAASATNHPNICTIHDIEAADDGQLFIVMAYYEGQTLKQRLTSGPLPVEEALEIATQIADGLAKAHAQGVVHRDIKPGNVILTEDGVRILDFGLATFVDALKLTTENATLGTVAYMSPEQVRALPSDARSDVWATGVVLYEMLTGRVPFQGTHYEAVAHAVRNETPAALRAIRPEVPEEVEQLVFRSLHKEPSVRYQNGREFAKALRRTRGQSVPLDLLTEVVRPPVNGTPHRRRRSWRRRVSVAAALAASIGAAVVWSLWSFERIPVAVTPVSNQTGDPDLDPYVLGWTNALIAALADSPTVRVLGHEQLLSIVKGFEREGVDVSSNQVLRGISANSDVRLLIVPTVLREGNGWKARVEIRDARTSTNEGVIETLPKMSVFVKDTAYEFVRPLATDIEDYFTRVSFFAYLASLFSPSRQDTAVSPVASTLDAAAEFERGLSAYEELEYGLAFDFFAKASAREPLNPLFPSWQSRVAGVMRRTVESEQLARKALELLSDETPASNRLLIEAIGAESRGDTATATARYQRLSDRHPDDPAGLRELAAYYDRLGANDEAIKAFVRVLQIDARNARAHVELCRVYNRVPDRARADEHARLALAAFRNLREKSGEAQTLLCVTETKRSGSQAEQLEAQTSAQDAVRLFTELGLGYNLARAHNYVGLAFEAQGRLVQADAAWRQALDEARRASNRALEPRVLLNLGVANEALGRRAQAAEYYRQSFALNETFGEQLSPARARANAAAILIEYGIDPKRGLSDVNVALGVFQSRREAHFEVLARQLIAAYHRYAGDHGSADQELNLARSVAGKNNLDDEIALINIDQGRSRLEMAQYAEAGRLFEKGLSVSSGGDSARARIHLAQARTMLGEFDEAETLLRAAQDDLERRADTGLNPLLYLSRGVLAYERERTAEARTEFGRAAALWTDEWPDAASVEASAWAAVLDTSAGQTNLAEKTLRRAIAQADTIQRLGLQVKCRLVLARLYVQRRRFDEALRVLDGLPSKDESRIGLELLAKASYWRSQSLLGKGDITGGRRDAGESARMLERLRALIPEASRPRFDARPDIQVMLRANGSV